MNKNNLELFGLDESATKADIQRAYEELRGKYLEERFLDGEAGNNAAKMLTKIDAAYKQLMNEIAEAPSSESDDGSSAYSRVEELIRAGNIQEAQRALDAFDERNGRWHYLQSVVFYRKNWINESKKQLEIAIQLEPNNEKYKESYRKLNERTTYEAQSTSGVYQGQTVYNSQPEEQMGGNFCAQCIQCCYLNMCLNCLCGNCCR